MTIIENNGEYHEGGPGGPTQTRGTADRRSKTTNKDQQERMKKYEELIGEFSEK